MVVWFASCLGAPEFSVGLVCSLHKTNGFSREKTEIEKGDDFWPKAVFAEYVLYHTYPYFCVLLVCPTAELSR
jgi:hypothetical protein